MNTKKLTVIPIALCLFIIFGGIFASAQTPDIRPLTIGQTVERELKGDEAHSYSLALKAGQYLDLAVEQKGIDVVVTLFDANGKKADEVDSPNGITGEEPLSFIVETGGNYRLEIRSLEKTAAAGRYEVKIKELRTATEKDKNLIIANKIFDEAELLLQQGDAESSQNAVKKYQESLSFFRLSKNLPREALTLNRIGFVYRALGDIQQSLKFWNETLLVYRKLEDKGGEASSLSNLGTTYNDLGDKQQALKFYNESLSLSRAVGDKGNEAIALNNIGLLYRDLGDKQKALKYFNESLPSLREIGDRNSEAVILSNIGLVYSDLGEKQQALKYFNESLSLSRIIGDKIGAAGTLNNIGMIYSDLGELQQAFKSYNESLSLSRSLGYKRGEAITLGNIGKIYLILGEKQQALKFFNEALPLVREVGDKGGEAVTLANIGRIYQDLAIKPQALKFYNDALQLFRLVGDKSGEALALNNIGAVYSYSNEPQQALNFYNEAIQLFRLVGDKPNEALALNNIGNAHLNLGEKQQALKFYSEALPLFRLVGDKRNEATTLDNLLSAFASDNPQFAIFYGKQSVNNLQILRSNVQKLSKNLQQSFLKSIENPYRRLADSLIEQKRYAEAQQILNSFKDQQFFDFNQNKQLAPLVFTAREAELTATLNQKLETVVAAIRAFDEYKRSVGERAPTADETAKLKMLEAEQIAANDDYMAFLKSAEKEFAAPLDGKDKVPVISNLTELQTALREVSIQTGEKSVAVYTLVGVDDYRALVVTSDSIFSVSTPIKGALLNEKAQQLWYLLQQREYDPQPLSKEIYDVIFAPLHAKLPADTKTILWSLDGSLRYLPMAALFDGKQYLVERFNNVVFTRAETERLTGKVSANLNGTGFGSSQKHRVKIGDGSLNLFALPSVKPELEQIFKNDDSPNGVVSGEVLLDSKFTRSTMIAALQKRRPLVHIASHFVFEPGDEAKSFLLLGDGSPFTLDEMKLEKDLFAGVELLTLSACDTAAQREDANGREIDGFAELAQRLGAGAVMASLWEVADVSTVELMTRFYKNYNNQKGANKANSLREAQIAVLRGKFNRAADAANNQQIRGNDAETIKKLKLDVTKLKSFKTDKNAPFAHPFYWSPFILIGNWR